MTLSGIILFPLFMALFVLPRAMAIPALYVGAVLSDAAIVNLGGRPLPVPWFVGLLVIARELWVIVVGRNRLRLDVLQRVLPLAAFAIVSCASLITALAFFQYDVVVLPGSAGFDLKLTEPFRLMPENLNQLVYTFLIVLLVAFVANLAADLDAPELSRWVDRGMRCSCALATTAVLWHIASFSAGVWFPDKFFHSSVKAGAWAQGGFGDLTNRPSGSFAEPSELTYFYAMALFYFFQKRRIHGRVGDQVFLVLSLAILAISTSTTAYLVIGVFGTLAVADAVLGRSARPAPVGPRQPFKLRGGHLVTVFVLIGAISIGAWFVERNRAIIQVIYEDQLVGKSQSRSYQERSTADRMAWQIFAETWGMGVGLGSHRPNSGLLTVVSGSGLLGFLAILWLGLANLRRPPDGAVDLAAQGDLSKPVRWAVFGLILVHLISGPNIQAVVLWTTMALAIGFQIDRRAADGPARASPARLALSSRVRTAS